MDSKQDDFDPLDERGRDPRFPPGWWIAGGLVIAAGAVAWIMLSILARM